MSSRIIKVESADVLAAVFGNILFADGHVTPSTGTTSVDWIKKANWYTAPSEMEDWNAGATGPEIR